MTATRDPLPADTESVDAGAQPADTSRPQTRHTTLAGATEGPAYVGSIGARTLAWAFAAVVAIASPILYAQVELTSAFGQVVGGAVTAVPVGVFGWLAYRVSRRVSDDRRLFWRIVTVGVVFAMAAQLVRVVLGASGMPRIQVTLYQSIGYGFALTSFCMALVVRLRASAGPRWRLLALDATSIAVVAWSTIGVVSLSLTQRTTGLGEIVYLVIPALVSLLVIGVVAVVITPAPLHEKRVEVILGSALLFGALESWLEVANFRVTGDTTSMLTAVVITIAWALAVPAPMYEQAGPFPRSFVPDDGASPWPYVALGIQPLLALWSVWALETDAQIIAIVGLIAVFAVSIVRQIEVLTAQEATYTAALALSDDIRRDVNAATTMLGLARRLAASTSANAAEAAVLAAVRDATGADHVWIERGRPAAAVPVSSREQDGRRVWRIPVPAGDGRPTEVIVIDGGAGGAGPDPDMGLLARIADQYGVAIERARLVRELERSRVRLRGIVDHLPSGVCEVDADGIVVSANSAFAEVCDRPLPRLLGRSWAEAFTMVTPDRATVLSRLARRETIQGEGVIRSATGVRKSVEYLLCRIEAADDAAANGPERYLGVLRDVTEQRAQRMRIVRLYQELQAKTRARAELLGKVVSSAEDERRNLAADIHDGPVQTLTALGLRLDRLRVLAAQRRDGAAWPGDALAEVAAIRSDLGATVDVVRSFMTGLRPPELDAGGIGSALRALCRRVETGGGPHVVCDVAALSGSVPEVAEIVAYRVAQEALQNVARHAHASECLVVCDVRGAELVLEIVDDGVGCRRVDSEVLDELAVAGHFGVATMAERVSLAGGRFELGPGPRGGTRVVATIPLEFA